MCCDVYAFHKDVLTFQCDASSFNIILLKFDMPGKNIFSFDYALILCDKYDPLKMMPFNELTYLLQLSTHVFFKKMSLGWISHVV